MVGRSHGIHAEPITFGFKAAGWFAELERDAERLAAGAGADRRRHDLRRGRHARQRQRRGRASRLRCARAGRGPSRDPGGQPRPPCRAADDAGDPGRDAGADGVEVRHLQRTEVGEAFEPFGAGQQGSSAMPHKRNPILAERVSGLARLLRGDALVGLENMALWHERDISHSSAERFVFERALGVAAYATRTLADRAGRPGGRCRADARQPGHVRRDGLLRGAAAGHDRQGRRSAGGLPAGAGRRASVAGQRDRLPRRAAGRCRGREWLSVDDIHQAMDLDHHLAGIEATYRALALDA